MMLTAAFVFSVNNPVTSNSVLMLTSHYTMDFRSFL